jgi:hypothetical protein
MDLGLAVAVLLGTWRSVSALAEQLAAGIGGDVVPPVMPLAPDARVSRRAISAPCAAASSCAFAHRIDVREGRGLTERVRG